MVLYLITTASTAHPRTSFLHKQHSVATSLESGGFGVWELDGPVWRHVRPSSLTLATTSIAAPVYGGAHTPTPSRAHSPARWGGALTTPRWGRAHLPTCRARVKLTGLRAWPSLPACVLLSTASHIVHCDAPPPSVPTTGTGLWRVKHKLEEGEVGMMGGPHMSLRWREGL